jgi:hypothetical protein
MLFGRYVVIGYVWKDIKWKWKDCVGGIFIRSGIWKFKRIIYRRDCKVLRRMNVWWNFNEEN